MTAQDIDFHEQFSKYRKEFKSKIKKNPSYLALTHKNYVKPSDELIRDVLKYSGWTPGVAQKELGINSSTTMLRYIDGDTKIPSGIWRLMLIKTGLVTEKIVLHDGIETPLGRTAWYNK